ncbi:hypothetical protein D3C83_03940 [compost metagenome]
MQQQAERRDDRLREGREVLERVVGQVVLQGAVDHERKRGAEQRVAVGNGLRDDVGADDAGRGRAVVDHHRLVEALGDARAEQARRDVAAAAG